MCDVVSFDDYGPESLQVTHTGGGSTLATAIARAANSPLETLVPVFTETEFMDADLFLQHQSGLLNPRDGGVVIPFMIVPCDPSGQEADEREDVVRVSGFASYTFECNWRDFTVDDHARLALLMEDVLDEISYIKADAEGRVPTRETLWPLVQMRCTSGLL